MISYIACKITDTCCITYRIVHMFKHVYVDAPILPILFRTYMSTMVAFFLISSSMIIPISLIGDAPLSTGVLGLK